MLAKKPEAEMVYFFYAHLTEIRITQLKALIPKGTILGTSGETGNANGMNTVSKGAHLHFEVRLKESPLPKLVDRIDPNHLLIAAINLKAKHVYQQVVYLRSARFSWLA